MTTLTSFSFLSISEIERMTPPATIWALSSLLLHSSFTAPEQYTTASGWEAGSRSPSTFSRIPFDSRSMYTVGNTYCTYIHIHITHIHTQYVYTKNAVCRREVTSVRNNGQHSDIVRPFWHFVQPKKVWVRHLAEHNLMFISYTHSNFTKSFVLRMSTYAFIIC